MQSLRHARPIIRLVLVWFALFIGAAVASPLVRSEGLQMVCSGMGGMQLIDLDADQPAGTPVPQGMDCPLCMPAAAPPPSTYKRSHPDEQACVLRPLALARLTSLIGPPWQARAPPSLSF